ncbi:hypothetical protein P4388_29550 [Bacillus thuringiensis]|uniref:hypothetical protein n=1 Tax=Bacillus thuringiensis TaxID=1428 RepID=UPI00129873A8|nr:hypothetical protein [Bacillus thuringiensis]MED3352690.1 hypothetical protein [Bacillus thuringiensis]MRB12052.1 hypothetical protein [Bacillus thuringiensis]
MFKKNLGKLGVSTMALGVMISSTAKSTPVATINCKQNNVTSEIQNQELSVDMYNNDK